MCLTGYPTSCLTLAVTLVKTTRQQRETLPIAGFALDADKWSGTGSISAGTRAMIWSTPARSITASRRNQKRSCMTASGQSRRFGHAGGMSAHPSIATAKPTSSHVSEAPLPDSCTAANGVPYSITSSAAASSLSDTLRPSIFAVSALMTSSNLVACTTGRSAGFAPMRMRPA
jgi:hypothetical protein